MKFTIGDRILLKRTGEEGEIIAFIGKDMMEVSVNGTHFPVYTDEVDHPYLKWFTDKKTPKKKKAAGIPLKEKTNPPKLARGIYLSFLPVFEVENVEDIVSNFRIFLLNETPSSIRYKYTVKSAAGDTIFEHAATLHPFGNLFLHSLSLEVMNQQPRFHWEVSEQNITTSLPFHKGQLRIRPQKLFTHIQEGLSNNQATFSYLLTEDATSLLATTKKVEVPVPLFRPSDNTAPQSSSPDALSELIDLHIDALSGNAGDIPSGEILQYQLRALQRHIDLAIVNQLPRIVIIHGVGTGALRAAVQEVLLAHPGIREFSDNWERSWGYGATVAYLK